MGKKKRNQSGKSNTKKEQAPAQSAEHTSEESAKLKKQPSNTQEQQEVPEAPVPEQMNITQSEGASSSVQKPQDESATALPVDIDNKEEQALDQHTEQILLQTEKGEPGLESKDVQPDSPLLSPQSSASGEGDTENSNGEYVKISPEDIAKENPAFKDSGNLQDDTQPKTSVPSPSASSNVDDEPPVWNVTDDRSLLSPSPSDDKYWINDENNVPSLDTADGKCS